GMALYYLMSGSPAVVGNLWDVTDKDLDRYTMKVLDTWIDEEPENPLSLIVSSARQECKLKSIIGAAPVYYGVPVFRQYSDAGAKKAKTTHSEDFATESDEEPEMLRKKPQSKKSTTGKTKSKAATKTAVSKAKTPRRRIR